MAKIDPTTLTGDQCAAMLHTWAAGLYPSEAAVQLLIAHRMWLGRRDFLTRLVDAVDDGWGPHGSVMPMAAVDWDGVEEFLSDPQIAASATEAAVLRLAASLAGTRVDASLLELTTGLDQTNTALLLEAVAHRAGWHERGVVRLVTGTVRARNDLREVAG